MRHDREWFVRCDAVYEPVGNVAPPERCGFPSLETDQWYLHPDEPESATFAWGAREVQEAKERRRAEADG